MYSGIGGFLGNSSPWQMPLMQSGGAGGYSGPGVSGLSLSMGDTAQKLAMGAAGKGAGKIGSALGQFALPALGLASDIGFGLWGAYDSAKDEENAEITRKAERTEDRADMAIDRRLAQQNTERTMNMSGIDRMMAMLQQADTDSRRRVFKRALAGRA